MRRQKLLCFSLSILLLLCAPAALAEGEAPEAVELVELREENAKAFVEADGSVVWNIYFRRRRRKRRKLRIGTPCRSFAP